MNLKIETPGDRAIVFTRLFRAPPQLVFDAHTKPALIRQWLLGPAGWTMPVCEVDLRVGGKFRYVWRREGANGEMGMTGVYREIAAPGRIVHTELFDDDWTGGETLCATLFQASGAGTAMTLTVEYASKEARAAALSTGMADGMEDSYARLDDIADAGARAGERTMQKITPFLWYDGKAEEAARFYIAVFGDGRIVSASPMSVTFELFGQRYMALNGGPMYAFTPAFSLFVTCATQAEVDDYWNKLIADGGEETQCGWCKDRYGLSWQIIPEALTRYLGDPDPAKANRVEKAMLAMKKIIVADLVAAYAG
jgi:predicted 3-demethylubiquinone-9 3-methyltransferase (glyoxalase superfamily)/uncharacterized protein YndB with AHSA1/START domain